MGSLTDVQIKQWIKAKEPVAKADGEGLTFTLSSSGRAAWILRYRIAGKAKEKTLGQYPYISLADARRLAAEDRAKIQLGVDVAVEKQRAKREAAGAWKARNGDDVRGFIVPLTDSVLKWFADLKELAFQSDYVLPTPQCSRARRAMPFTVGSPTCSAAPEGFILIPQA